MDGKNINLMPKDLRSEKENSDSKIKGGDFQPKLVVPQKEEKKPEENKIIFKKKNKLPFTKFFKKKEEIQKVDQKVTEPIKKIKSEQPFELPKEKSTKFHEPKPILRAKLIGQDSTGVDLIPTAAKIRNWQQIGKLLFLSFLISLFIIIIFYIALFIFERNLDIKRETTTKEISQIEDNLINFENLNNEIKELGGHIILVYNALNKHIYWTNFFNFLEEYTLADVYYNGLSAGSGGGILILNAVGKDFNSVAKQLKILEQSENFITNVEISSAILSEEGVEFSITLSLDPNLFYYQEN